MKSSLRRIGAPTFSLAAGVAALLAAGTLAVQSAPAAVAAAVNCIQTLPGIDANPAPEGYDNRPNLFVKGGFTVVQNAAEMEGKAVVLGDASVTKASGIYNVGTAGVGSGLWPQPGTDHLVVGGSLTANSGVTVDVGANNTPGGGAVSAGGDVTVAKLSTNGGKVTTNDSSAADAYRDLPARIQTTSASYAALPATGTVSVTGWGIDLVGDGTSATQVFTLDGNALGTAVRSLEVKNVPATSRMIINVTGGPQVTLGLNALLLNGVPVPISDSTFGELAGHMLWNYTEAQNVHVTGSAQVPGSMLVPSEAGTTTIDVPGYNGRVYVNGDFVHGGSGSEVHAYPFPDELTSCTVDPTPQPTETATSPVPTETATSPVPTETATSPVPTETATSPVPTETATSPVPTETATSPVPTETATSPVPTETATSPVPTETSTSAPATSAPATSTAPVATPSSSTSAPVNGSATPTAGGSGDLAVTGASSALLPTALAAFGFLVIGAVTLLTVRGRGRH
ncbi:choice-of-anchor A family protein [Arthrobacter woluwensis]|uniref:choice-of-anchor A family protein n=1 Tax=Arthrobacter woluwensis TaxID=156980 RepID=UPI0038012703